MSTFVSWKSVDDDPFDVAHNMIFNPDEAVRVTLYEGEREAPCAYMTLEKATRLRDALTWAIDMGSK